MNQNIQDLFQHDCTCRECSRAYIGFGMLCAACAEQREAERRAEIARSEAITHARELAARKARRARREWREFDTAKDTIQLHEFHLTWYSLSDCTSVTDVTAENQEQAERILWHLYPDQIERIWTS